VIIACVVQFVKWSPVCIYTVVSWQDWYSDITLYKSGILLNPRNVKMYNNYGLELKSSGRVREAEQQYMVSVQVTWTLLVVSPWSKKGICMILDLDIHHSIHSFTNTLIEHTFWGHTYRVTITCICSVIILQKAIELEENYHDVYFNYGNLLSDEGKIQEAAVK